MTVAHTNISSYDAAARAKMLAFDLTELGIRIFHGYDPSIPVGYRPEKWLSHTHKHGYYEMHVICEGSSVLQAEGAVYPLEKGAFCLVSPGVDHEVSDSSPQTDRFCLSFEPLKKQMPAVQWLLEHTEGIPVLIGDATNVLGIVRRLQDEDRNKRSFGSEAKMLWLSLMMLETIRALETQPHVAQPAKNDSDEARSILIDMFLNSNFYLSAGEEELAAYLGISRRQLDRILKKLYNKSYREKVTEIRAQIACDLLRHSDMSIREISEQVGYSTTSNFTTFFKRAKGMTPQAYKNKYL